MKRMIKMGIEMALKVEPLDDPAKEKWRLSICRDCDRYDEKNDKCMECGCFMDIKASLKYNHNPKKLGRIELTHCPLGKWDDKEVANAYRKIDRKPPLE